MPSSKGCTTTGRAHNTQLGKYGLSAVEGELCIDIMVTGDAFLLKR